MASGVLLEKSSDDVSEENALCSVCKEQNKTTAAEHWCVDCGDYYCSDCVKLHTTIPAMRRHKLLSKGEHHYEQMRMMPTERCERHGLKVVDMFCEGHDEVGCSTCMFVEHRSCKDVVYIPEISEAKIKETGEMEETTQQAEENNQNLLQILERNKEKLHQNKQLKLDEATTLYEELEEKLKNAAQATKTRIEQMHSELQNEIERRITTLQNESTCLQKARENTKQSLSNPSQFFVASKLQKKTLASALSKHKMCQDGKIFQRIEVNHNEKLKTMLSQHQDLGTVSKTIIFKENGSLNIKLSEETAACDIYGMCIMEDGLVVVSDRSVNKSVKAIDPSANTISHFALSSGPWGLCHVRDKDIAVCLPEEKYIKMFTVDAQQMSDKKLLKLGFKCICVSYHDNILYITDEKQVYKCDMEGQILNKFQADLTGQALFKYIYALTVNKFNGYIFVADYLNNGTIILDVNGKMVNRIPKLDLDWPHGLCSGDVGNIFVSGYNSKKIIRLGMNGENLGSILEGLYGPQAICFDSRHGRLYVSNHNRDNLLVYDAE